MIKYFVELRHKFILIIFTFFSMLFISYCYKDILLFLVTQMHLKQSGLYFIFTNVMELFHCYLRLIFFFSIQVTVWYLLYHVLVFFSFALYMKEFKMLKFFFINITFFWFLSLFLSSYIIVPYTWQFFLSFQVSNGFYFEARLIEYLDFFMNLQVLFLLYCQLFTLLFVLIHTQIIKMKIYKYRKFYYYFFFLFSTCITPPDLFSQLITTLLIIIVYETFLLINIWID